jgi:hypothetical protein
LEHKLVTLVMRLRREATATALPEDVDGLRREIEGLRAINDHLEKKVSELLAQQARMSPEPVDHSYTMEQFMLALATKRGRTYGWRTDYARATQETPGCRVVHTDDIQKWQKDNRVPEWAVDQISRMSFKQRIGRAGPEWKPGEVQFLIDLCIANPREPNASLANKCQERFGRDITESSIKGAKFRLNRQGRLETK